MDNFRFHLKKGGKKLTCPSCGKKGVFVPYVDENNNIVDAEKWGRCERVNSCCYQEYPKLKGNEWTMPIVRKSIIVAPTPTEYVEKDLVEMTSFRDFIHNVFFMYLVKMFGRETAFELQEKYNIGTASNGGTIFWQQDDKGRFRTGKVIYYNANGKRNHDRKSWFVHTKIKQNFTYQQCFFGLHLVDGTKPVALCESEKTAVMMSVYQPDFVWLASGGSEMLSPLRLAELKRLDKVFADNGQFDKWKEKTRNYERQMDVTVDRAVTDGLLEKGSDILDLVLMNKTL